MSAKKRITRETLLKAAFDIVRKNGKAALNVRSLAQSCKCSTQPIYSEFGNAKNLKNAVAVEIAKYFDKFVVDAVTKTVGVKYKAVGLAYIEFAKSEPHLFKLLFMDGEWDRSSWGDNSYDYSVNMIMKAYGFSHEAAVRLHSEMWIFVHGIATMIATDYQKWDDETISIFLNDAFLGIARYIRG